MQCSLTELRFKMSNEVTAVYWLLYSARVDRDYFFIFRESAGFEKYFFTKTKTCTIRESNTGPNDGNVGFYH